MYKSLAAILKKKRGKRLAAVSLLIVINIVLIGFIVKSFFPSSKPQSTPVSSAYAKEIQGIKETQVMKVKETLYRQLMERVGPVQAQEELQHSGIPFDGTAHLLNHTAGDWLYEKFKEKGMIYCKDYFLSSCYHGFLIRSIGEHGMDQLDSIMKECQNISEATATQCSHAIGHGLLAWRDYANLPQALKDCDTVATLSKDFTAYNCYDGAFMENNWAVHNNGQPSPDKWIKMDDPTYPCYDSRIDEKYRKACWSNQPQMVFKDIRPGDLVGIGKMCSEVKNIEYRETCFDSVARQIVPMVNGNLEKVYISCDRMPVGWKSQCVISIANSFFSMGDRVLPFKLCDSLPEDAPAACYDMLQRQFKAYVLNLSELTQLCSKVPKDYLNSSCSSLL